MSKQEKMKLENHIKKQRIIVGSIVEISIDDKYYVYAQILKNGSYAFFDFRSEKQLQDYSILQEKPVLFIVGVYDYVIKKNIWRIVGRLPIRESLNILPLMYIYDVHKDAYSLYDNNTGEITPCSKEEARGLERASVWGDNHIEDRIRDYYNNVPCIWLNDHYKLFPYSNQSQGQIDK
jgi:hypothetical protein